MRCLLITLLLIVLYSYEIKAQISWEVMPIVNSKGTVEVIIKGKLEEGVKVMGIHENDCPLAIKIEKLINLAIIESHKEIVPAQTSPISSKLIYSEEIEIKQKYKIEKLEEKSILKLKIIGCEELDNGNVLRSFRLEECFLILLNEECRTIYLGQNLGFENCTLIKRKTNSE